MTNLKAFLIEGPRMGVIGIRMGRAITIATTLIRVVATTTLAIMKGRTTTTLRELLLAIW